MEELRGKDKRFLRARGNQLTVHVQVGHKGIDKRVVRQVISELENHELIKLKLHKNLSPKRKALALELSELSDSELIQVFGNAILLYKAKKPPIIELPD